MKLSWPHEAAGFNDVDLLAVQIDIPGDATQFKVLLFGIYWSLYVGYGIVSGVSCCKSFSLVFAYQLKAI